MELHHAAQAKGRASQVPLRPHFNIYGPPNLKHTLCACRRFIFRKGVPIRATEYANQSPETEANGAIPPTWQDANIQVWALSIAPISQERHAQAENELEARRQHFDAHLNTFEDHQAPENETPEDREARYDRIRSATIKAMFDSNWTFDTLVERHISNVLMPAAMFVRNPDTHGYEPYNGPKPGGPDPLPDITVFTRTPWPGAGILALPPTKPAPECVSYIVRTHSSRGAFDVARAKALNVQPGPDFGRLAAGKSVQNRDGEWIKPEQVLGSDRPGQGVAILEVPSIEYLQSTTQRAELQSLQVMSGIGAIIWILGPGVIGHPMLSNFMGTMNNVQHVISSRDTSPNRITYDSVAGQATRLGQVDPSRYSTPVCDDSTVPQESLYTVRSAASSALPKDAIVADRGLRFVLMPKFTTKTESASELFEPDVVSKEMATEVIQLAEKARQAVQDDYVTMHAWKQLLARPDTEVITLGTGSALPSKYRNVSATLVRVPGVGNYLFDCGENTLGQLARLFPLKELVQVLKDLRVVWISHLHADHHLGTASVIRAWYSIVHGGIPNPQSLNASTSSIDAGAYGLSVISHSGMLQWLHEYSSIEDIGYSRILPLEISANEHGKGSALSILNSFGSNAVRRTPIPRQDYEKFFGFSDIQAVKVAHCHGSMAVSITFPPSSADDKEVKPLKVSYSGDCRPSYNFSKIGKDTTVLIHEATFDDEMQGDAKAKKHSTTSEALGIGAQMNAKAVVLTHFSQRYQKIPVLRTVTDNEPQDPLLDSAPAAEEAYDNDEEEVDPTTQNADNMDIYPSKAPPLQQAASSLHKNQRVIQVRNKDMKVAIAFDYMRVKIGEIIELEKFNDALNALLIKEEDVDVTAGGVADGQVNANGKKMSEDEAGGSGKKQKKEKRQRNN